MDDTLVDKVNVLRVDAEEYVPTAKPNEVDTAKIVPVMFTEHHVLLRTQESPEEGPRARSKQVLRRKTVLQPEAASKQVQRRKKHPNHIENGKTSKQVLRRKTCLLTGGGIETSPETEDHLTQDVQLGRARSK